MPIFRDAEPTGTIVPEGEYVLSVKRFEQNLSTGAKTKGSDMYEVVFEIEPGKGQCIERLIDHPSTDWKIDLFLKSAGVQLTKGQPYEFNLERAKAKNARWVNPLGLRCWAHVVIESYEKRGGGVGRKNAVAAFLIGNGKVPPAPSTPAATAATPVAKSAANDGDREGQ